MSFMTWCNNRVGSDPWFWDSEHQLSLRALCIPGLENILSRGGTLLRNWRLHSLGVEWFLAQLRKAEADLFATCWNSHRPLWWKFPCTSDQQQADIIYSTRKNLILLLSMTERQIKTFTSQAVGCIVISRQCLVLKKDLCPFSNSCPTVWKVISEKLCHLLDRPLKKLTCNVSYKKKKILVQ